MPATLAPSTPKVRTYADGFGIWHAEVDVTGPVSDEIVRHMAEVAVETQIKARNQNDFLVALHLLNRTHAAGVTTVHFIEADTAA